MNIKKFDKFNENNYFADAVRQIEDMKKESEIMGSIKALNELIEESETDEVAKSNKLAQFVIYDLATSKINKLERELRELKK